MLKAASATQKKKVEEQLEGSNNMISSIKVQLAAYEAALEFKQQALQVSPPLSGIDSKDGKDRKKALKKDISTLKSTKKTLEKQIGSSKEKSKTPKVELIAQLEQLNEKLNAMKTELEDLEGKKRDHIDIVSAPKYYYEFVFSTDFNNITLIIMTLLYFQVCITFLAQSA
jgi:chromosome segregation ATPase